MKHIRKKKVIELGIGGLVGLSGSGLVLWLGSFPSGGESFLSALYFLPLFATVLFELLLGAFVGWFPRWPILRALTLAFVPVLVAVGFAIFRTVVQESGDGLELLIVGPIGFVAYGVGMIIGYLVRRFHKRTC